MAMGQKLHSESLSTRLCCKVSGVKPWIFDPETHMQHYATTRNHGFLALIFHSKSAGQSYSCAQPVERSEKALKSCSEVCPATLVKMASNIY